MFPILIIFSLSINDGHPSSLKKLKLITSFVFLIPYIIKDEHWISCFS